MLMMLPFEAPTIFEGIHKSYFRMPRVVKDQRGKFENDDLFRQLSHESAVKYTGFKDRPLEERQMKFIANCQEGHTEVSVVQSGNQFTLMFNPAANPAYNNEGCDFDKELGKVHIKSGFILNGVCVLWRGWIDLQRLEGFGCLEFDEYRAYLEDAMLKQRTPHPLAATPLPPQVGGGLNPPPPPQVGGLNPPPPPQSQVGGLNQPLAQQQQQQPPPPPPPHGAATVTGGLMGPGTGQGVPPPPPPQSVANFPTGPPVSLADTAVAAAHYGNAAIAAAAAAAFHQAFSVGAGQVPMTMPLGPPGAGLHSFGTVLPPTSAPMTTAGDAREFSGRP